MDRRGVAHRLHMNMPEKRKNFFDQKHIFAILLVLSIFASIKPIFVDYTMDEEYQIVMAYRCLRGDHIFGQMWEPHQTSAFICIFFMYLYHLITGTYTGVVIALRVFTELIRAALSLWVFRVFKKHVGSGYAAILGLIYFNSVPKLIDIPEFSNMQLWFFTVMALSLMEYYYPAGVEMTDAKQGVGKRSALCGRFGKSFLLIVSSCALALEILSYPSCIILFPVTICFIAFRSGRNRIRDILIYTITDAVCAGVWLLIVLRRISLSTLIRNARYTVEFDLTHVLSGSTEGKASGSMSFLWQAGLMLIVIFAISLALTKIMMRKKDSARELPFMYAVPVTAMILSDLLQIVFWIVLRKGYEYPQIHLLTMYIAAFFMLAKNRRAFDERRKMSPFLYGFIGSVISVIAVFYISDLQFFNALPHGLFGILTSLCIMAVIMNAAGGEKARKAVYILFLATVLTFMIGKGASIKGGRELRSVFDIRGIMKAGPAAGILSDYMCCYINNSDYEDFMLNVSPGEKVLIVTNMVLAPGTTPYMFGDYEVCHFSIVDPTSYDERLLKYWELYPEKKPDVIVVDCWYGQLMEDPDNWIMQYIENDFGYEESVDGKYVRFYKRSRTE